VKSIPNLRHLVTRDWSHLHAEDRWIEAPVIFRGGFPVVAEAGVGDASRAPAQPEIA